MKIRRLFLEQFKGSLSSCRVLCGYLTGICYMMYLGKLYHNYAGLRPYQQFEPYILYSIEPATITILLIGFVLIIADAPFINAHSAFLLYRASREEWQKGMELYILIHALLYQITTSWAACIFYLNKAYIKNTWSRPMINQVRFPSGEASSLYHLPKPSTILIEQYTPWSAYALTILLLLLYMLIIGYLLLLFNTLFNLASGTVIAALVHMSGYIWMRGYFSISRLRNLSLFYHAIFGTHLFGNQSIAASIGILCFTILLLVSLGSVVLKSSDFLVVRQG